MGNCEGNCKGICNGAGLNEIQTITPQDMNRRKGDLIRDAS